MNKKKTIKVDFKYFYEGFDPEKNFFMDILKKRYNVIISKNPDFLFYSVYSKRKKKMDLSRKGDQLRKISPKLYIFLRNIYSKLNSRKVQIEVPKGNFIKILYSTENQVPDMSKCDYGFSSHPEEEINHPNYFRIPMHLICDYPYEEKTRLPYNRKINFKKIKKEKNKFCIFLYSQDINSRNNFYKLLNKYKKIDAPGRCMNNMPPISNKSPRESRVSKNWVKTKLDFIKNYKFTIAFENDIKNGWVTEKLTHPLLVNSIPIYIGTENVKKDFNTKCFINYADFKNTKEFIKHIIEVDNNDELYKKYLDQPIFNNKKQHYFSTKKRFEKKLYKIIDKNEKHN